MAEDQLTPRIRQELASVLFRERVRVRKSLQALGDQIRSSGESQTEENGAGGTSSDVASDLADQEVALALQRNQRDRLVAVEAALER